MFRPPILGLDFGQRVRTVLGLVEMRKAGLFRSLWCDADRLRVVYPLPHDNVKVRVTWETAEALVEAFYAEVARKPVAAGKGGKEKRGKR